MGREETERANAIRKELIRDYLKAVSEFLIHRNQKNEGAVIEAARKIDEVQKELSKGHLLRLSFADNTKKYLKGLIARESGMLVLFEELARSAGFWDEWREALKRAG